MVQTSVKRDNPAKVRASANFLVKQVEVQGRALKYYQFLNPICYLPELKLHCWGQRKLWVIRSHPNTSDVEIQFSSVTQSCPTLCNPMDCSTPGFPITNSQSLLKLIFIELMMPSNHLILCIPFSSCLQSFRASRSVTVSQFFILSDQNIEVSASASVLPMNIQD